MTLHDFLRKKHILQIEWSFLLLLKTALCLLVLAYLVWEIYWYQSIGLYFIKWHTHIASSMIIFGLPIWLIGKIAKRFVAAESQQNIALAQFAVLFAFVLFEFFLIATDIKKLYSETRLGYYLSPYEYNNKNIFHVFHSSDTATNHAKEYSYLFHYNNLGFSGSDWAMQKDSSRKRVICLGDSFTEGDGAPQDSSYPSRLFSKTGSTHFEILNAGVRGSDPVFGYYNLEKRLLPYQPDLVLQTVSENDVLFDLTIRGGFERFVADSLLQFSKPPAWEPLYAMNYTLRIFFETFNFNMKNPAGNFTSEKFQQKRNALLQEIYSRFDSLAAANNFKVVFVFYPTKWEVDRKKYDYDFTASKKIIATLNHVVAIDIFDCYFETFKNENRPYNDYYWVIDGHHNSRGYDMMAKCIYQQLQAQEVI